MKREFQTVTTELTDNELAAVSGGWTFEDIMISSVVARPGGATSTGTATGNGTGTAGWDIRKSKA